MSLCTAPAMYRSVKHFGSSSCWLLWQGREIGLWKYVIKERRWKKRRCYKREEAENGWISGAGGSSACLPTLSSMNTRRWFRRRSTLHCTYKVYTCTLYKCTPCMNQRLSINGEFCLYNYIHTGSFRNASSLKDKHKIVSHIFAVIHPNQFGALTLKRCRFQLKPCTCI